MDTYQNFINKKSLFWSILFILLLLFAYLIYAPGIKGTFIFDDIPNLSPLGKYSNFNFWDNFWLFLLEGQSGPTGRPISLASFYLNDSSWPTNPSGFIKTNILIHLLNGIFVYCLCYKLSNSIQVSHRLRYGFATLVTALWLLHPIQSTTVLYVIQRMTELSATFMLLGMIFYLYGRKTLNRNITKGFFLLFFGVGFCLLLAIFSKENGILLTAYILVIEFCLLIPLGQKQPKYFMYWLIPTIIFPFICMLIYLTKYTDPGYFVGRNFSFADRLLTEPRILFDYLYQIFIPNITNITLFHDDYRISTSLLNDWPAVFAIIGLIFLMLSAIFLRKKKPMITFAIAWFFAGHLIESTVIPLELYYDHRNYIPILGIAFVVSYYALTNIKNYKIIAIICFILLNSFITFQNANLWGKPYELAKTWFINHPESERSKQTYLYASKIYGFEPTLDNKEENNQDTKSMFYSTSVMIKLSDACLRGEANKDSINETLKKFKIHLIHATTTKNLIDFIDNWKKGMCPDLLIEDVKDFLINLSKLNNLRDNPIFMHDVLYTLSDIYRIQNNFNQSQIHLDKAFSIYPNYETLKVRVLNLASAELYDQALISLNDIDILKLNGFRSRLALKIKQKELIYIKNIINIQKKL